MLAVREPHDLVFEGRAITRTNSRDLAVIEGGLANPLVHQLAHPRRGVEKMTTDLRAVEAPGGVRKRHRRVVPTLLLEP